MFLPLILNKAFYFIISFTNSCFQTSRDKITESHDRSSLGSNEGLENERRQYVGFQVVFDYPGYRAR